MIRNDRSGRAGLHQGWGGRVTTYLAGTLQGKSIGNSPGAQRSQNRATSCHHHAKNLSCRNTSASSRQVVETQLSVICSELLCDTFCSRRINRSQNKSRSNEKSSCSSRWQKHIFVAGGRVLPKPMPVQGFWEQHKMSNFALNSI